MRKGIFIPDITVEMFKNASLEAVEELLVSGTMEDIEIPNRPHGEWVFKNGKYRCSICLEPCATFCMNEPRDNFCLYCGSDNRKEPAP